MDIYKAILELKAEKQRLDRAIAALEEGNAAPVRPGRKSWNSAARRAAAERMKKYWAGRKVAAEAKPADARSDKAKSDKAKSDEANSAEANSAEAPTA